MKTNINKIISLFLTLVMLFSFTACTQKNKKANSNTTKFNGKTIIDQAGRTVKIPKDTKTIGLVYGVATNYIIALGKGENIVAVNSSWKFLNDIQPSLKTVGTIGNRTVDYEALAEINPDIFIGKASDIKTLEAVTKMGIPAIGIAPESINGIYDTLNLLGEVLNTQERAKELTQYYKSKVQLANNIVSKIPKDKRKTAIVMGSKIGRVAGGDMLQSAIIETAGGINCAKQIKNKNEWTTIGTETIFNWNPDFIFCTNKSSSEYSVEDLMKDKTWSNLKSIKSKHVLVVPCNMDSWEFPGLSSILGILWMLNQMYPDYYSESEFIKEVDECYKFLYGKTFERNYLGY